MNRASANEIDSERMARCDRLTRPARMTDEEIMKVLEAGHLLEVRPGEKKFYVS
jgi:hypothetical protein